MGSYGTSMNSGFMIWRRDSLDIITKYLHVAENTICGHKNKNRIPNDQTVWDQCFKHKIKENDFSYIPWEMVGSGASKLIYQIYDKEKYIQHTPTLAFTDISDRFVNQPDDEILLL
tara:strand:- start:187 stop:534 length:348 start_codon:yes stop_codon:yes gene_type:complete